ncbi:MAG: hypothetical protein KDI55_00275 [Anaerolineae bacterium]|nr:hypothetical protein [Anaerolineae bacterium]
MSTRSTPSPRSLEAMARYPTSYEVVLCHGADRVCLGFTVRRTKAALMGFARANAQMILDRLTEDELEADWHYSAHNGVSFGSVRVAFSGRTERECASILSKSSAGKPSKY